MTRVASRAVPIFFLTCIHCPTSRPGIAYTTTYLDTQCTQAQVTVQRTLACHATNQAGYESAFGYCNQDPSVIPLPNGYNFTTEM